MEQKQGWTYFTIDRDVGAPMILHFIEKNKDGVLCCVTSLDRTA